MKNMPFVEHRPEDEARATRPRAPRQGLVDGLTQHAGVHRTGRFVLDAVAKGGPVSDREHLQADVVRQANSAPRA